MDGATQFLLTYKGNKMSSYSDQIRGFVSQYQSESDVSTGLIDKHEIAAWAYERGLMKPHARAIIDILAADIAQAFREEYRVDVRGRRYRAKHAVKQKVGDKSMSLWADIDENKAPRSHFV